MNTIASLVVISLLMLTILMLYLASKEKHTALVMSIIAVFMRSYFFTYSVFVAIAIFLPVVALGYFLFSAGDGWSLLTNLAIIAAYLFITVACLQPLQDKLYRKIKGEKKQQHPNPLRAYNSEQGSLNKITDQFIAWIGTVKYFLNPLSLISDPKSYKITGDDMRELIDSDLLQPGDILLRGYDGYLDGIMIGLTGEGDDLGKFFSHAALYVGNVSSEEHGEILARRLKKQDLDGNWCDASPEDIQTILKPEHGYFKSGEQMVIHSMTKGVFMEDILTFARCDYLIVLRLQGDHIQTDLRQIQQLDNTEAFIKLKQRYDEQEFVIGHEAEQIENRLKNQQPIPKSDIEQAIKDSALGKIGSCYDFQFTEIDTAHTFSCSEFVYYCYKGLRYYLGLYPVQHALFNCFFPRATITPEDFYRLSQQSDKLCVVWKSRSLKAKQKSDKHEQDKDCNC